MLRKAFLKGAATGAAFLSLGATGGARAQTINGAGATFPAPIYQKWFADFHAANPGVTFNYQPVGSGQGIAYYKAGTVFFGASDAPMIDADLNGVQPTLQIPTVAGAVVLAYNIPGFTGSLKLSPDVVADIYLKRIKSWDDPRIKRDNPTVPAAPIVVVHRSDGSGTTNIFTNYLAAVSRDWAGGPGIGKTVSWPAGVGGNGNPGVANLIRSQRGAIGYIELTYALENWIGYAALKNAAGAWVEPSIASTAAAVEAGAGRLRSDVRNTIVNGPGRKTYPIVGLTFLLVPKSPRDKAQGRALVSFLKWAMGPGQAEAEKMNYGRLSAALINNNFKALNGVR